MMITRGDDRRMNKQRTIGQKCSNDEQTSVRTYGRLNEIKSINEKVNQHKERRIRLSIFGCTVRTWERESVWLERKATMGLRTSWQRNGLSK